MSRISPFHFNVKEYDDEELENICPRYLKWMKKVKAFDFSKRKRGKIDRTVPSFELKYKLGENSKVPKRSKSILSRVRKGGQNLRVRVRTSADLWRRWIRGGIMYNTELNEQDELEQEEQEKRNIVTIKVEPQPQPQPQPQLQSIEITKPLEEKVDNESKTNTKTEVINKTPENDKSIETKTITNKKDNNNKTENSDQKANENKEENKEEEPDKSEIKDNQSINEQKTTSEENPEPKIKEDDVKIDTNSVIGSAKSSTGMPEVVANND